MSPSLFFPSPVRRPPDLPPYGPADWRRLQPVLLRRSLALSTATALAAGLLLGLALERNVAPPAPPVIDILRHHVDRLRPLLPEVRPTSGIPPSGAGLIVPADPDVPPVDDLTPPSPPGPFDPGSRLPVGFPDDRKGSGQDTVPDRPDPKEVVIVDELPFVIHDPKPEYPALAQQAGMEGSVLLQVLVNREGKVAEVLVVRSSPMFDEAAQEAIRHWRFRPALLQNRPVPAWVTVPVRFTLR